MLPASGGNSLHVVAAPADAQHVEGHQPTAVVGGPGGSRGADVVTPGVLLGVEGTAGQLDHAAAEEAVAALVHSLQASTGSLSPAVAGPPGMHGLSNTEVSPSLRNVTSEGEGRAPPHTLSCSSPGGAGGSPSKKKTPSVFMKNGVSVKKGPAPASLLAGKKGNVEPASQPAKGKAQAGVQGKNTGGALVPPPADPDDEESDEEKPVDEEETPEKVIADLEAKDGFEKENDLVTFFKYKVCGDYTYTHSSIIGSADQRMPRTGKLNITRLDYMTKLYCAISFFYRQKRPLTLVEMATTRFRFYEDVDLFLPPDQLPSFSQTDLKALEKRWIDQLLKIRGGAVFGAVWRSDDVLGICQNCLKTTVHVFSSSGFSTKAGCPKISLHFVWPHLVVTKREAKAIRLATIQFLSETTTPELDALLRTSYPDYQYTPGGLTPWEEIYDAAPIEGASLKMPFNDKGIKPNRDTKQCARLENRPKVPVGTFLVTLVPSQMDQVTTELLKGPNDKEDLKWLVDGSIRLDMESPPPVANIWILASNKTVKAIRREEEELASMLELEDEREEIDVYATVKEGLVGAWVDSRGVYLEVIPFDDPAEPSRLNVVANEEGTRFKVAEIEISEDVFSSPVAVYYRPLQPLSSTTNAASSLKKTQADEDAASTIDGSEHEGQAGDTYVWQYSSGDPFGVWHGHSDESLQSWLWRKPAVPALEAWPSFGSEICLEVGESVDTNFMVLAAKLYAIGQDEKTGKLLTAEIWRGCVIFSGEQFEDPSSVGASVAIAAIGSAAVGLRALLDLRGFINSDQASYRDGSTADSDKSISAITILCNTGVTEQALNGTTSKGYLQPVVEVLQGYKHDLLLEPEEDLEEDKSASPEIAVTKVDAAQNKASRYAKEVKHAILRGEDVKNCIGDFELFDAVMESVTLLTAARGKKVGTTTTTSK
ncbi:unnamed protein product [Amoebophrya sp. A25]|nr:unnamed protein product [Amoebophrya sp. A25]|eukprot:GSA25T00014827001.1